MPIRSAPASAVLGRRDDDHLVVAEVGRAELRVAGKAGRRVGDHGRVELATDDHGSELGVIREAIVTSGPPASRSLPMARGTSAAVADGTAPSTIGGRSVGGGARGLASAPRLVDQQPGVGEQRGAGRRRRHASRAAVQQADPHLALEGGHLAGQAGLGEPGRLGGRAERARPAHLDERVPRGQRHGTIMTEAHGGHA